MLGGAAPDAQSALFSKQGNAMFRSTVFAVAIAVLAPAAAWAEPAKPETIEELLVVSKAQSLIESTYKNVDDNMQLNMNQALSQVPGNTEEKRAYAENFSRKISKIMRDDLNWDSLKPMFVRIYSESFTQEELVGVLDFYKTPAGQAMINKMPLVMQKTMVEMQQRMGPMMQRVSQAAKDAIDEAKAQQAAKQEPVAKPAAAKTDKTKPTPKPASK
jgi:hypothetical protein